MEKNTTFLMVSLDITALVWENTPTGCNNLLKNIFNYFLSFLVFQVTSKMITG